MNENETKKELEAEETKTENKSSSDKLKEILDYIDNYDFGV